MKILAVDDDAVFLQFLTAVLHDAGYYAISTADSAEDAIRIVSSEPTKFDCFLLDIKMPGMCGVELCREIRGLPGYRDTPIIMLTALSDDTSIRHAFDAGATDYVTKPLRGLELGSRIRLAAQLVASQERHLALLQSRILTSHSYIGSGDEQQPSILALSNLSGVVEYLKLENYLLKINKDICSLRMFAIFMDSDQDKTKNIFKNKWGEIACDLAETISNYTNRPQSIVTCPENGVLVVVSKGLYRVSNAAIEEAIRQVLCNRFGKEVAETIDVSVRLESNKYSKVGSGREAAERLRSIALKTKGELEDLKKQRHLQELRAYSPQRRSLKDFFRSEAIRPRRLSGFSAHAAI